MLWTHEPGYTSLGQESVTAFSDKNDLTPTNYS